MRIAIRRGDLSQSIWNNRRGDLGSTWEMKIAPPLKCPLRRLSLRAPHVRPGHCGLRSGTGVFLLSCAWRDRSGMGGAIDLPPKPRAQWPEAHCRPQVVGLFRTAGQCAIGQGGDLSAGSTCPHQLASPAPSCLPAPNHNPNGSMRTLLPVPEAIAMFTLRTASSFTEVNITIAASCKKPKWQLQVEISLNFEIHIRNGTCSGRQHMHAPQTYQTNRIIQELQVRITQSERNQA